jgi:AbrB family looped-hinge helix DNA binding protein
MGSTARKEKLGGTVISRAKVTSKGQVTLPVALRKRLGVKPGDTLVFEMNGKGATVLPEDPGNAFEKYRGIGTPGIAPGKKAVLAWVREIRGEL